MNATMTNNIKDKHNVILRILAHQWFKFQATTLPTAAHDAVSDFENLLETIILPNRSILMYTSEIGRLLHRNGGILLCWGQSLDFDLFCDLLTKSHPLVGLCETSSAKFTSLLHLNTNATTEQAVLKKMWNKLKKSNFFCSCVIPKHDTTAEISNLSQRNTAPAFFPFTDTLSGKLYQDCCQLFQQAPQKRLRLKVECLQAFKSLVALEEKEELQHQKVKQPQFKPYDRDIIRSKSEWEMVIKPRHKGHVMNSPDLETLTKMLEAEYLNRFGNSTDLLRLLIENIVLAEVQKRMTSLNVSDSNHHINHNIEIPKAMFKTSLFQHSDEMTPLYSIMCHSLELHVDYTWSGISGRSISHQEKKKKELLHTPCESSPHTGNQIKNVTIALSDKFCCPLDGMLHCNNLPWAPQQQSHCVYMMQLNKLIHVLATFEFFDMSPQVACERFYTELIKSRREGRRSDASKGEAWMISHEWGKKDDSRWKRILTGGSRIIIYGTIIPFGTILPLERVLQTIENKDTEGLDHYNSRSSSSSSDVEDNFDYLRHHQDTSKALFSRLMSDPAYITNWDSGVPGDVGATWNINYHYECSIEKLDLIQRYTLESCLFKQNPMFLLDVLNLLVRHFGRTQLETYWTNISTGYEWLVRLTLDWLQSVNNWFSACGSDIPSYDWIINKKSTPPSAVSRTTLGRHGRNTTQVTGLTYKHVYVRVNLNRSNEPRYETHHNIDVKSMFQFLEESQPDKSVPTHLTEAEEWFFYSTKEHSKSKRCFDGTLESSDKTPQWVVDLIGTIECCFNMQRGADTCCRKLIQEGLNYIVKIRFQVETSATAKIVSNILATALSKGPEMTHPLIFADLMSVILNRCNVSHQNCYWPNIPLYLLGFLTRDYLVDCEYLPHQLLLLNYVKPRIKQKPCQLDPEEELSDRDFKIKDLQKPAKCVLTLIDMKYCKGERAHQSIYPESFDIYRIYDSSKLLHQSHSTTKLAKKISLESFEQNVLVHSQLCLKLYI